MKDIDKQIEEILNYKVGQVQAKYVGDEQRDIWVYYIMTPDRENKTFFLQGEALDVGQKVRMKKTEDGYELLGAL